jgi:hypothetical protein
MAAALGARGASAIIASQWPLQDAAAARFAETFYEVALAARERGGSDRTTVGEAMQAGRVHITKSVSPALWGSLILIGNPWHRLVGHDQGEDACTRLLLVAADPSSSTRARGVALKAAKAALQRDPSHLRLAAAVAWAQEAAAVLGGKASPPSAQWAVEMADVARDLGSSPGEFLLRAAAFDIQLAED